VRVIDLNCDMGESFGRWRLGADDVVLPLVSSANIACGFHAGDPLTMVATVRDATRHGVVIGAHPGLPDLLGFGRRHLAIAPDETYAYIVTQVGALMGAVQAAGTRLHHVKLHGAMTVVVETSEEHAAAAVQAILDTAPEPRLYWRAAPVPDPFSDEARRRGVEVVLEMYPDLVYAPDGHLAPPARGEFAVLDQAIEQVRRALSDGEVLTSAGAPVGIEFSSICVHGDSAEALDIVRASGCTIAAPGANANGERAA